MTPVSCPVRDNNAYHRYRSATCRRYVASRPTRNGSANGRWTRTCGTSANRRVNAIAPSRPALTAMLDSVRSPPSVVPRAGMKFQISSVVLIPPIPTRKPERRRRIGSGCQPNRATPSSCEPRSESSRARSRSCRCRGRGSRTRAGPAAVHAIRAPRALVVCWSGVRGKRRRRGQRPSSESSSR